jgi:peptidase M28-like protein
VAALDESELERVVTRLAAITRETASAGEHEAARVVADELAAAGARAELVPERVHGTYWRPNGLLCAIGAAAAMRANRVVGALVAAAATAGVVDDLEMGPRLVRRHLLSSRTCTNVVAEVGPADAEQTVVVHGHHDAAHTGLVFHPALARAASRRFGRLIERKRSTPPMMAGAAAGPALVALGHATGRAALRRAGAAVALGYLAALANIGRSGVVPGANDNLSGVAVLVSLARAFADDPPRRTRIVFLSSGAEESFLEGMQAWGRRCFASLPVDRTTFLIAESVGSEQLLLLDGEGLLRLHRYPAGLRSGVADCARRAGVALADPFRFRFATGGQIPLRAGYPTAVLSSIDWYHAPRNYHWPSDQAEAIDYGSVAGAARVFEAVIRQLDG